MTRRSWIIAVAAMAVGVAAYLIWWSFQPAKLPAGFASSNGRIEAVEIDVAARTPGRIVSILVNEGDFVTAGQVVAQMDTDILNAQLREAMAEERRALSAVDTARSSVVQRESEKEAAQSLVAQKKAEFDGARRSRDRAEESFKKGVGSVEVRDNAVSQFFSAEAAVKAAEANVAASGAAIATAKSQIIQAEATVEAARARVERLRADIEECTLKAPRDGRVQHRIAQPGEVLSAGGKLLNMVDLTDVYMTFFLPTDEAGLVSMGSEVHLVLDAAPRLVIPARVSYVADVAQFTPKTVETAEERHKLMFRIKARIEPELLKKHIRSVKTGLPGMAYVQLDPHAPWPAHLQIRVPQ